MARIAIDGIEIAHDWVGPENGAVIVLTPGGRFPRDSLGLPQLAEKLAAGGKRVLLWDRPNCGESDIAFEGESESALGARCLTGLLRASNVQQATIAAGSAGSRLSLIMASRAPELVSHLVLWWISGGPISLAQLAAYYCGDSATAASVGGMEAVVALPSWQLQLARNPRNRDIILREDPKRFIEKMQNWAQAYAYSEVSPVPGMSPADFAALKMPTLIFRSGESDLSHTRRTSEWAHALIPQSKMIEPPWPDQEWNMRMAAQMQPGRGLFENWPDLAPFILDFTS